MSLAMTTGELAAWVGVIIAAVGLVGTAIQVLIGLPWFRPRFKARIDKRRQAIRLDVKNRGRRTGRVNDVLVINSDTVQIPCEFAGLPEGRFQPADIPGRSLRHLILAAVRARGSFPADAEVKVKWGLDKERTVKPKQNDAAYYGEDSHWP